MTSPRQLHLGAFMRPISIHTGAWRYPGAVPDANFNFPLIRQMIQKLEAAKFDGCFFADLFGLYDLHQGGIDAYVRRGGQISYLDPTVVLPVMTEERKAA